MAVPPDKLELFLLGAPRVKAGGRTVVIRLRRGLALLAYLAMETAPASRDQLAELLWPESPPGVGRTRLRRLMHRVAGLLGFNPFHADGGYLGLNPDRVDSVDAREFMDHAGTLPPPGSPDREACLAATCDAWTGGFMQGFELPEADPFSDWMRGLRDSLGDTFAALQRERAENEAAAGRTDVALLHARRLVLADPLDEAAQQLLIGLLADSGRQAAAAAQYAAFEHMLTEELGVAPAAATRERFDQQSGGDDGSAMPMPATRYARSHGAHIAWQAFGTGRLDCVVIPGFVSHLEQVWLEPRLAEFMARLGRRARIILLDRRGIGLSDRTGGPPTPASTAMDIEAVLDAADSRQAVLFGISEGGPMALRFAREQPQRCTGLILFGTMARGSRATDYPWALSPDEYETWLERLTANWGGPAGIRMFAPSVADDPAFRQWWARTLRLGSSPGAVRAVLRALRDIDIRDTLGDIRTPALVMHRRDDRAIPFPAGADLAGSLPNARWKPLEGADHWPWIGDADTVEDTLGAFFDELATRPTVSPPAA